MIRNLIPLYPRLAIPALGQEDYARYGGLLISPTRPAVGLWSLAPVFAADNDCFSQKGFSPVKFIRLLKTISGVPNCLFVNAPDVVCDARATLERFEEWQPIISDHGLPVGFVLQNGITAEMIPWERIDALFIGGDTRFKFTPLVQQLVKMGKERGKWIHNGRVNSGRRIIYSASIGCDSFDGTGFLKTRLIQRCLQYQKKIQRSLDLCW